MSDFHDSFIGQRNMGETEGFASDSFRKKSRFSCLEIRKNTHKQVFDYKKLTFLTIILFRPVGKSLKNAIFAKGQLERPLGKMEYKETKRRRSECLECGQPIHYGRTDKKFCSETIGRKAKMPKETSKGIIRYLCKCVSRVIYQM